jgi:hypothetical protein
MQLGSRFPSESRRVHLKDVFSAPYPSCLGHILGSIWLLAPCPLVDEVD